MKFVRLAIGAVIAIAVVGVIVTSVTDLTETGGLLNGTVSGTLLDLAPIVFIAGILGFLFTGTGANKMD
ncbi:MAG: hypothetical protein QXN68_02740 [Thermoplasmata archaeon]